MDTPLIVFTHDIRVRYADTDQMQVVYNGNYFTYFEVGRTELLRALGLPYSEFERSGTRLPVIESYCRFLNPARYDDLLTVETRMDTQPTARMRLDYRIYRKETSELLVEGFTVHAFQDIATLKPVRPPDRFLEALRRPVPESC